MQVRVRTAQGYKEKLKPKCSDDYNQSMNGVNCFDQRLSYYSYQRRCRKLWKKLFFHLMGLATTYAYILYTEDDPMLKKMSHMKFLELMVAHLTKGRNKRDIPTSRSSLDRLRARHSRSQLPLVPIDHICKRTVMSVTTKSA